MPTALIATLVTGILAFAAFLAGFFHLHSTMGKHHLRGRKTWAEEQERLEDGFAD